MRRGSKHDRGHSAAVDLPVCIQNFCPPTVYDGLPNLGVSQHFVRAAVGEDVTQEELGGSRVHCRKSGVGDLEVADDKECLEIVRKYLSFFPSHNRESPPVQESADPVDRRVAEP